MPVLSFDNDGNVADNSSRNRTVAINGDEQLIIWNFNGPAVRVQIDIADASTGTAIGTSSYVLTRSTGKQETLALGNDNFINLQPDESVHLNMDAAPTGAGAGATTWRIGSVSSRHGLRGSPGTGHTGSYDNLARGLYYAVV